MKTPANCERARRGPGGIVAAVATALAEAGANLEASVSA